MPRACSDVWRLREISSDMTIERATSSSVFTSSAAALPACCMDSSSPTRRSASENTPSRLKTSKKPANTDSAIQTQ